MLDESIAYETGYRRRLTEGVYSRRSNPYDFNVRNEKDAKDFEEWNRGWDEADKHLI